jgi:hypothetical protein
VLRPRRRDALRHVGVFIGARMQAIAARDFVMTSISRSA